MAVGGLMDLLHSYSLHHAFVDTFGREVRTYGKHMNVYLINIGIQVGCLQTKRTNADGSDRSMGVNDFKVVSYLRALYGSFN